MKLRWTEKNGIHTAVYKDKYGLVITKYDHRKGLRRGGRQFRILGGNIEECIGNLKRKDGALSVPLTKGMAIEWNLKRRDIVANAVVRDKYRAKGKEILPWK